MYNLMAVLDWVFPQEILIFYLLSTNYNFNPKVAVRAGLNLNYVAINNYLPSFAYGVSTIVLVNPVPQIQLSVGLNQSRVNYQEEVFSNFSEDYWEIGLILGDGFITRNVTVGFCYNLLQNDRYNIEPFVPFVRVYL